MVEVVPVDQDGVVARVRELLAGGGVVVVPTDTVYGLAAMPADADAMARLFEAKGRSADVPVAVLVADASQGRSLVADLPDVAEPWLEQWWPGPLTLVAARRPGLGYHLGEPRSTIGIRCPDHDLLRRLSAEVGPIAATSANRHGQPTPPSAAAVAAQLGDGVDLVVDGGSCPATASTVVDVTATTPTVLRRGGLDPQRLGLH